MDILFLASSKLYPGKHPCFKPKVISSSENASELDSCCVLHVADLIYPTFYKVYSLAISLNLLAKELSKLKHKDVSLKS